MSIQYFLQANPLKPGKHRAVLLRSHKVSFDAFLDHCEVASTVGRADALAVVEMMAGWIEQQAADGREVDFGPLGQTRLGMAGVFEPREESIRPDEWRLTIGWQVARRLQARVDRRAKKAGLERRPPPNRGPYVAAVTDLMSGNADAYTPGGLLELRGARLKFDVTQSDEGVFFRPAAGGAEVRADRYLIVFPKTIQAQVPATLTGPQRLIVRRRLRPSQPEPAQFTYDTVLAQA
jgi:hypothetical protein